MPKLYGTGLYGKGNYGRATTDTLSGAYATFAITGQAASLKWAAVITAAVGSHSITGNAALMPWAAAIQAANGLYALSGVTSDYTFGNIWSDESGPSTTWTAKVPGQDPWSSIPGGSTTWTPQPTSE